LIAWRRFREQKPSIDDRAKSKPEQHTERRKLRLKRTLYAFFHLRLDQRPDFTLTMAVSDRGFYYFPEYRESNTPRDHEDFDRLERILVNWHSFEWLQRWQARRFVRALLLSLALRGRFHDLTAARSWEVRLFAAMYSLGFQIDGWIPLADLDASDFSRGWVTYRLPGHYIPGDIVNRDIGFFNGLLCGDAIVRAGEVAGSVQVCRLLQFSPVVPLSALQIAALPRNVVAIGLDRITGEQVEIDVAKCFHLLICGASR
jgi:hypothetical protein